MDCQILQDDLNSLAQWETYWQMKFNIAKCHSMRVTRHLPENQIQFEYSLHQQKLEQVQYAKYLGITITDNLDWGQYVSEISYKATKTMGFLRGNREPDKDCICVFYDPVKGRYASVSNLRSTIYARLSPYAQ